MMNMVFGWFGILWVLFYVAMIVITIALIVAVFQIRNATQRTAERVDDLYRLLQEKHRDG